MFTATFCGIHAFYSLMHFINQTFIYKEKKEKIERIDIIFAPCLLYTC